MLEITQMLFKSSSSRKNANEQQLPPEIFLKESFIMQGFTRLKTFQPDEANLDGFRKAGSDSHLYNKMMEVVRSCKDPCGKIHFLNDFYERITRQHISSILNKEVRSNHAVHQVKYIEQCKHHVCDDLRDLVNKKLPTFYNMFDAETGMPHDEAMHNKVSPAYWNLHAENTFLACSFAMDHLLAIHNEQFFFLTPANMHIRNSVWVSCIMFRLGLQDFTYIGMPVVICDAAGKLKMSAAFGGFGNTSNEMRDGVPVLTKIPSAGLDFIRNVLDSFRTSYQQYLQGHSQTEDSQKMVQLKRFTEAGLQVGFVLFIGNRIEQLPNNNLAEDTVMPEGPPEKPENLNALLSAIPRYYSPAPRRFVMIC